jgi:hypothetical protein
MRVVWLSWYISGVCAIVAIMASAITFHPSVQYLGLVLAAVFGGLALVAAGLAIGLWRLPLSHHVHQSKPLAAGLVVAAVAVTLLLASALS